MKLSLPLTTIKYDCIHMAGVENLIQLKAELSNYIEYYNNKRLHSSLGYKQPAKCYQISIEQNLGTEYLVYCKLN
ncbi:MAG: integrase core domain-containing protein [Neisseriaceae bacterium]|jgi:hypothetical protein